MLRDSGFHVMVSWQWLSMIMLVMVMGDIGMEIKRTYSVGFALGRSDGCDYDDFRHGVSLLDHLTDKL